MLSTLDFFPVKEAQWPLNFRMVIFTIHERKFIHEICCSLLLEIGFLF